MQVQIIINCNITNEKALVISRHSRVGKLFLQIFTPELNSDLTVGCSTSGPWAKHGLQSHRYPACGTSHRLGNLRGGAVAMNTTTLPHCQIPNSCTSGWGQAIPSPPTPQLEEARPHPSCPQLNGAWLHPFPLQGRVGARLSSLLSVGAGWVWTMPLFPARPGHTCSHSPPPPTWGQVGAQYPLCAARLGPPS